MIIFLYSKNRPYRTYRCYNTSVIGTENSMSNTLEILAKENNGLLTYKKLIESGITKRQIKAFERDKVISKVAKGFYYHKDYLEDRMFVYQKTNRNLIYSHGTAAYLLGMTDRYPRKYTVTTYSNNHPKIANKIDLFFIKKELLELGKTVVTNNAGNKVDIYDKERTVCDVIRHKDKIELQVYSEVLQNYFNSKVNSNKLAKYANVLGIKDKVAEIAILMMKQ